VTVTRVGTPAIQTRLSAKVSAGATNISVRSVNGFVVGNELTIGTPANKNTVAITAINPGGPAGPSIEVTPALEHAHGDGEDVVFSGTGLDVAAPMQFTHASNLPFSNRGTGITFQPATAFAHSSNEPVQALGAGITLDSPLAYNHSIDAVAHDAAVTTAGYQGTPAPDQWFGGPELTAKTVSWGRSTLAFREGNMVLRDASGLVVDTLNYGAVVDPWAAEGYQATSGSEQSGCHAPAPGAATSGPPIVLAAATNSSAGRFPDGVDADSNCTDFLTQAAATLSTPSATGAANIKVSSVEGFGAGEKITIDTGADLETAIIATVGTAGATTVGAPTGVGATVIPVAGAIGFRDGQTITMDAGANSETAVIVSVRRFGAATITVTAPLTHAHSAGAQVSGSGITLTTGLARVHAAGTQVSDNVPTPGAPNQYHRRTP
jgi:hypothetical protein